MVSINEQKFLQKVGELGYNVSGSLESILILIKSPTDHRLKAGVKIVRQEDGSYKSGGKVKSDDSNYLIGFMHTSSKNKTIRFVETWINSVSEPCFTGNTDDKRILEIYRKYIH